MENRMNFVRGVKTLTKNICITELFPQSNTVISKTIEFTIKNWHTYLVTYKLFTRLVYGNLLNRNKTKKRTRLKFKSFFRSYIDGENSEVKN